MASETFADELRAAVSGDKRTLYTELMLQAAELLDAMNTRPAPAATDTGLVTVEYQVRSKLNGHWVKDNFLSQQLSPDTERRELVTRSQAGSIIAELQAKAKDYREYSERLVKRLESEEATRSQADELLAAERAGKRIWMGKAAIEAERVERLEAENAAKDAENAYLKELVAARGKTIKSGNDRVHKLKTENAELTARIKELDRYLETASHNAQKYAKDCEALEAKLAAAQKALNLIDAVLGGKPS